VPSIGQLGIFSLTVISQFANVPVDQPINSFVLACPSTKAEQLVISGSTHAIQHGNLLRSYFAISLEIF
jgi:hypothetical protein